MTVIDISAPNRALIESLGLAYDDVAWIVVRPDRVRACFYLRDANGEKHFDPATGKPAQERRTFAVRT